MFALVEWTDEDKCSTISLSRVKEPRKDFDQYQVGDVVKASCHGFPGVHNAKLLAIKDSSLAGKKELERLAEEYIAAKNQSLGENGQQPNQPTDDNNNTTAPPPDKTVSRKGKRSTLTKDDASKKARKQANKENKAEQEKKKEENKKKKDENKKKKELALKRNADFLQNLDAFRQETQVQPTTPSSHVAGQQNTRQMTPIPQLPQHPISVHQPPNNTQTQQQQNPNQQTLYPRQQHYPLQPINSQSSENVYHTQLLPYPPMHHSTPITDTPHRPYAIHPTRFNQMQEQPYQPVPTPVAQQPAYTSQSAPCPVAPQPAYSFQSAPGPVAPQPEYSSHSAPGPVAPQPTFSSQSAPGPVAPQPAPGPVAPQPAYSSKSSNRQAGKQSTEFSSLVEAIPGMPSAVSEGDEILENFLRNTDDAEEIQADEVTDDVDVNNYKAALEAKEKEVAELKRQLEALKEELATVKQNQAGSQTELRTQSDGLPRAGLVPKEIAERSSMIELMPNSGVFVYPRDLRIASKKTNGTSIARFLMSVFYTSKELIERGNVMGVNGKHGLDKQITKAILDYAVIKGKETESVIKCAMRSKMSALVSFEKKKSISVQK